MTSYTLASIIHDETTDTLRNALIGLVSKTRPSSASSATIRVDPAPAFQSIFKRLKLLDHNIILEIGRFKNKNKNPVIDKAIKELERELRVQNPIGGPISSMSLDMAVATLNSRLRNPGLSAQEMWTGRDQVSGEQLAFEDRSLIEDQFKRRLKNHPYSEKSKARGHSALPQANVEVGDLVYVYSNKHSPRPRYIIISITDEWLTIKKLQGSLFSNQPYKVKRSEVFKVPDFTICNNEIYTSDSEGDEPSGYLNKKSYNELRDENIEGNLGPSDVNTPPTGPEIVHRPGSENTGPPNRVLGEK